MKDLLSLTFPGPAGGVTLNNPHIPTGGIERGSDVLQIGIVIALIAGIALVVFFGIWAGIQIVTSGGDKQKVQTARSRLTYAIVGLVVMFFAWLVITFMGSFFGLDLKRIDFDKNVKGAPDLGLSGVHGCYDELKKADYQDGAAIGYCGLTTVYGTSGNRFITNYPASTPEKSYQACWKDCCKQVQAQHPDDPKAASCNYDVDRQF